MIIGYLISEAKILFFDIKVFVAYREIKNA